MRIVKLVTPGVWLLLANGACSEQTASPIAQASQTGPNDDTSAAGEGGAAPFNPASPGTEPEETFFNTDPQPTSTPCGLQCSADLGSVLDCNGELTEQCPPDLACKNGACVAPCDAVAERQDSRGCEFWALKGNMQSIAGRGIGEESDSSCFAAFIANTWKDPVRITLARDGVDLGTSSIVVPQGQGAAISYLPYDPALGLAAGEVAIVFLASPTEGEGLRCPIPAAVNERGGFGGPGRGHAFRITTDRPVAAYSIVPYGGEESRVSSASLLLPTSVWGNEYVAVHPQSECEDCPEPSNGSAVHIVANESDTRVTLLPKAEVTGGVPTESGPADSPVTYSLSAGEYIQLISLGDLSGSLIQADKPIGVWAARTDFGFYNTSNDDEHEQIPPVRALGTQYAGVRYKSRDPLVPEEPSPWRLVGVVDGTELTWTPSQPPGAPTTLDSGEVIQFTTADPFFVRSQSEGHVFYMGHYMGGGGPLRVGDPDFTNVVPVSQFLDGYVFLTDPTYPETSLVVTRRPLDGGGFADVTLDCYGLLGDWQAVGDLEYTRVTLVEDALDVGGCSNGRHQISSEGLFGVTVWGWGRSVSYAYPAGAGVRTINEVVLPPLLPPKVK